MIERAKGWLRWFWEKAVLAIFNKVIVVAVGGIVATLFAFNWEDLDALWRYYLQPGNISGVYSLDGHTYKAAPPYDKIDLKWRFVLKHGGTRVFGTIGPVGKVVYNFRGYKRDKFLSMAYGGVREGGLGTGTITLQRDVQASGGADIFWGYTVVVECMDGKALFVRCPAVMYEEGHPDHAAQYQSFMTTTACERVEFRPPESCEKRS